jgi:hypothetical protein
MSDLKSRIHRHVPICEPVAGLAHWFCLICGRSLSYETMFEECPPECWPRNAPVNIGEEIF